MTRAATRPAHLLVLVAQLAACAAPDAAAQEGTQGSISTEPPTPSSPADENRPSMEPPLALELPSHFRPLPELASAFGDAARQAAGIDLESWAFGDPAAGAYLVIARTRIRAAATASFAATLHAALRALDIDIEPANRATSEPLSSSRTHIRAGSMAGQLWTGIASRDGERDASEDATLVAALCFQDGRRASLESPCDRLLSSLEARP